MTSIETIKKELFEALAGQLDDALLLMLRRLEQSPKIGAVVAQSGRYHQTEIDFKNGLLTPDERNTTLNLVRAALLALTESLSEADISYSATADAGRAAAFGLAPAQNFGAYDTLLTRLRVDWKNIPVNDLYLVNCDRIQEIRTLRRLLRERSGSEQEFQFYFINACPMQKPESFARRVILEILDKLDESEREAVLVRREASNRQILIEKLPVDLTQGLEGNKKLVAKYFEERFDFHDRIEPIEAFLRACVCKIRQYKYVTFIFRIDAKDWDPFLIDYLQWFMDTFSQMGEEEDLPIFLFFFPVMIRNLHENPTRMMLEAAQAVESLGQKEKIQCTVVSPLTPVSKEEIAEWFAEFGEADAAKIEELLLLTLQREKSALTRLGRYLEQGLADMYDIELLQEEVIKYAMK